MLNVPVSLIATSSHKGPYTKISYDLPSPRVLLLWAHLLLNLELLLSSPQRLRLGLVLFPPKVEGGKKFSTFKPI